MGTINLNELLIHLLLSTTKYRSQCTFLYWRDGRARIDDENKVIVFAFNVSLYLFCLF